MAFNPAPRDGERRSSNVVGSLWAGLVRIIHRITALLQRRQEDTREPRWPSLPPEAIHSIGLTAQALGATTVSREGPTDGLIPLLEGHVQVTEPSPGLHQEQLTPPESPEQLIEGALIPRDQQAELEAHTTAEKVDQPIIETSLPEEPGVRMKHAPATTESETAAQAPQTAARPEEGAAPAMIPDESKLATDPFGMHKESNLAIEPAQIPEESNGTAAPAETREKARLAKAPIQSDEELLKEYEEISQNQEAHEGKEAIVSIDLGRRPRCPIRGRRAAPREKPRSLLEPSGKERERVESPYIEIDLAYAGDDERTAQIVFPSQRLRLGVGVECASPQYVVEMDCKKRQVPCRARIREGYLELRETGLGLLHPIGQLCIVFPPEAGQRTYRYNHEWEALFVFSAIGANRGRMLYRLTDLPKRPVWVLLDERYELLNVPDIEERQWVWQRFKPYRVDLRRSDALQVKDKRTGEIRGFTCRPTFKITGDQLVDDDFAQECPIVTGNRVILESPYENEVGWDIWIQNKAINAVVIAQGWTGKEPLTASLPPPGSACDLGEFQVDIWDPVDSRSDATMFFRWLPSLQLDYPRELQFPHPYTGHASSNVTLTMRNNLSCATQVSSREYFRPDDKTVYEIAIPPDRDTTSVSVQNTEGTMSPVSLQVSVPRLRWKVGDQGEWCSTQQTIAKTTLRPGLLLDVIVSTNDQRNRYDIDACLGKGGEQLQLGRFERRGGYYTLGLNQFFDTIHNRKDDELALRLDIRKNGEPQLLGTLPVLGLSSQPVVTNKPLVHISGIRVSEVRRTLRRARVAYPNAAHACDLVLRHVAEQRGPESQAPGDFVIKGTALLKFILDTLGPTKIKGHRRWSRKLRKRWSRKITQAQRKCSD